MQESGGEPTLLALVGRLLRPYPLHRRQNCLLMSPFHTAAKGTLQLHQTFQHGEVHVLCQVLREKVQCGTGATIWHHGVRHGA